MARENARQSNGSGQEGGTRLVLGKTQSVTKSLLQLQAEEMASRRFAELMSNAGVPAARMATEVLYMLPRGFVDVYQEVFIRALGGKDDGGTNARGQAQAEAGVVGKAKGQTGMGSSAGGKTFKKHWVIADERMLDLKTRIDKRLRAMAREIRDEIEGLDSPAGVEGRAGRPQCPTCKGLLGVGWRFCATCGHNLDD